MDFHSGQRVLVKEGNELLPATFHYFSSKLGPEYSVVIVDGRPWLRTVATENLRLEKGGKNG